MASSRKLPRLGCALAMLFTLGGPALAAEPLGALSPDGKDACFGRVYDAAHLKAHPHQKVTRIFFHYGSDPVSHPNEEPASQSDTSYNGYMATTVRGAKKPDWVGGWCGSGDAENPAAIHCGMDCDRTMANVKVDEKGRLLLTDVQPDLYLDAGSEEELGKAEYDRQALGSDDDGFLLDPMPDANCTAEFAKIDPIDPALGAPLRERLRPDEPFCYGRDYDANHLSTHPGQVTTSIRVFRGPAQVASYAATNAPENWPSGAEIGVSVTTRDKAGSHAQSYSCEGEGDQWRCVASPASGDSGCDIAQKEIYLRRGANGTMMLANPNSSLPIVDLCSKAAEGDTRSDDKVFRLEAMAQSACAP